MVAVPTSFAFLFTLCSAFSVNSPVNKPSYRARYDIAPTAFRPQLDVRLPMSCTELMTGFTNFDEIWFENYASVFDSDYNKYSPILLLLNKMAHSGMLEDSQANSQVRKTLQQLNLPAELMALTELMLDKELAKTKVGRQGPSNPYSSAGEKPAASYNSAKQTVKVSHEQSENNALNLLLNGSLGFWESRSQTSWVQFDIEDRYEFDRYEMMSSTEPEHSDPMQWEVYGSNDEQHWDLLDFQEQRFSQRSQTLTYNLDRVATYKHIRFHFNKVRDRSPDGESTLRLARIRFSLSSSPASRQLKREMRFPKLKTIDEPGFKMRLKDPRFTTPLSYYFKNDAISKEELAYIQFLVTRDYDFKIKLKDYLSKNTINSDLVKNSELRSSFLSLLEKIYYRNAFSNLKKMKFSDVRNSGNVVLGKDLFKSDYYYSNLEQFLAGAGSDEQRLSLLVKAFEVSSLGTPLSLGDIIKTVIKKGYKKQTLVISDNGHKSLIDKAFNNFPCLEKLILSGLLFDASKEQVLSLLERHGIKKEDTHKYLTLWYCIDRQQVPLDWLFKDLFELDVLNIDALLSRINLYGYYNATQFYKKYFLNKASIVDNYRILKDYYQGLSLAEKTLFRKNWLEVSKSLILPKVITEDAKYAFKSTPEDVSESPQLEAINRVIAKNFKELIKLFADPVEHSDLINSKIEAIVLEMQTLGTPELLSRIISDFYKVELAKRPVKAITWKKPDHQDGPVANHIAVEGIKLPVSDHNFDYAMVPDQKSADLVLTKTAKRMLKNLALQWKNGSAALLEGPTSGGKTSYIKYLSYKTKSVYRRVNLSYDTDVRDLIGRWVGGDEQYGLEELNTMPLGRLVQIASSMGIEELANKSAKYVADLIYKTQLEPHWEDGPVLLAMKRGEVLVLDEINLARPEVIESLNSLFDAGTITVDDHNSEVVHMHPRTRIFATMNPASYVGRNNLSDAFKSRCISVKVEAPSTEDLVQIIQSLYPNALDIKVLAQLVATHVQLSDLADHGGLAASMGGIAYTLRNLIKVVDRIIYFNQKGSDLDQNDLIRREVEEVYGGYFFEQKDKDSFNDILLLNMPGRPTKDFYKNLVFTMNDDGFSIGDIDVKRLKQPEHDRIEDFSKFDIVMTERTKIAFYKMVKALELGENVALVGERASGKTILSEYYAALKGQPFFRTIFTAKSDNMELIGKYTPRGWKDGSLLQAGRPGPNPGVFLGDELNLANDAVQERLNSLLDKDRRLILSEKGGGEEVVFDSDFRFIAAFNPPTKHYSGRRKLSKAIQNRLTVFAIDSLEEKSEFIEIFERFIQDSGVPRVVVMRMIDLHFWVAAQVELGHIGDKALQNNYVFSIRILNKALKAFINLRDDELSIPALFKSVAEVYYGGAFLDLKDRAKVLEKIEELAS